MVVTKVLRVQGRFLQNRPYDSRFEGLREGARHKRVINNSCNVGKKSVKTLTEEGSWERVKLTSFDTRLPNDVLDSSLRNRMKCCKWLTKELWIVASQRGSRINI